MSKTDKHPSLDPVREERNNKQKVYCGQGCRMLGRKVQRKVGAGVQERLVKGLTWDHSVSAQRQPTPVSERSEALKNVPTKLP